MPRSKNYDREEILESAMRVFWMKGYSATSISDLVDETGLNRFSLYNEFKNKDELYVESFRKYQHSVMEERMTALEISSDGKACLRAFFESYIDGVKNGLKEGCEPVSCLTVLNAVEMIGRETGPSEIMIGVLQRMQLAFGSVLQRAVEKDEIGKDTDIHKASLFLVGCTYGLDIMSKFLGVSELDDYVEKVLDSL